MVPVALKSGDAEPYPLLVVDVKIAPKLYYILPLSLNLFSYPPLFLIHSFFLFSVFLPSLLSFYSLFSVTLPTCCATKARSRIKQARPQPRSTNRDLRKLDAQRILSPTTRAILLRPSRKTRAT